MVTNYKKWVGLKSSTANIFESQLAIAFIKITFAKSEATAFFRENSGSFLNDNLP